LSHSPEPSGSAIHGEVDGLDTEDNMVNGLIFYVTLTNRINGHTPFMQTGAETSDTRTETVEPDPRCPWKGYSSWVGDESVGFRNVL